MQDFIENTQPRVLGLLLAAIVLLATAVQLTYLLWPQAKQFNALRGSHQVLVNAVNSSDGLEQQLARTRSQVDSLAHELHGDMAGLPAKQMESYIIGRLQKVSWETDVELISVRPGDGKKVQMFQESLFEVEIHAGYPEFFNWLQTIGSELGFIVVKRYEISPQGRELADPKLKIALTMVSYRMVQG